MRKILFATNNESKVKRFKESLLKKDVELVSLNDLDLKVEVDENGKTAIENALIKARAYYEHLQMPIMAMDDNLYLENVPELEQPGVFVRRVNGKRLNDEEMLEHYTSLVRKYGVNGKLTAKWVYGLAVINKGIETTYTWSKEDFYLVEQVSPIRHKDYPLNSISVNKKLNKYFVDLTEEDKQSLKQDESDVIDFIVSSLEQKRMQKRELIALIESLGISKEDFWLLSSSALVLRDLFLDAGDLDIAVTKEGLEALKQKFNLTPKGNNWYTVSNNIECVLDTKDDSKVEKVGDYNCESLEKYFDYLKTSNREKDKIKYEIVQKELIKRHKI